MRREGRPEEDSPDEDDDDDDDEDEDSEGMVARLDYLHKPTFPYRARWLLGDRKAGNMRVAGERRCLATRVPTRPLPLPGVRPTCRHDLPKRPVRAIGSRPLEWGR